MRLTACFVTKDHARSLVDALASVRPIATRIVVVDAGSTDGTRELAATHGAEVIPFTWEDDFAAACNAALEVVTSEWVLTMNPDEELTQEAASDIRTAMTDENLFSCQLTIQQQFHPDQPASGTRARQDRLFRNCPEARYLGRVHPYFRTPFAQISTSRNQLTRVLESTIIRKGYLSPTTPEKMRWVTRLLEAELRDRPDRLACRIELGRNLLALNDPRGHTLLAEAAATVAEQVKRPYPSDSMIGMLFEYLLTADPAQVTTALPVEKVRELVPTWFSSNPPVMWAAAQERFRAKDYPAAAKLLDQLLEIGNTGWYDCPEGFNPEIIGPSALMNLGLCYSQMQEWLLARTCFEHLLNHPRFGPKARQFYAECDAVWRANPVGPKSTE